MDNYSYSWPRQEGEKIVKPKPKTHHQTQEVTEMTEIITLSLSALTLGRKNCRPF